MQCGCLQCLPSLRAVELFDLHCSLLVFLFFLPYPVHPGAETHTHTEAPTVAANWTDSLVIDLLQVSLGSLSTVHADEQPLLLDHVFHSFAFRGFGCCIICSAGTLKSVVHVRAFQDRKLC